MSDVTSRALAALQACSSSDEEDDQIPVANPRMLGSRCEGSLYHNGNNPKPINDQVHSKKRHRNSGYYNVLSGPSNVSKPQHESELHREVDLNNAQFSSHNEGLNLKIDSLVRNQRNKSVERHKPQFVRGSQKPSAKKMRVRKHRRKDFRSSASISVSSPENTTKSSILDKRKQMSTASSVQSINYPTDKAVYFQKSISKLSLSKRLNGTIEEEESIKPHQLSSQYHNIASIIASTPFDSRTMISLHQAKEFNRPLLMQYESSIKIMSQKDAVQERNGRVDTLEKKLLEEVELCIRAGKTDRN